MFEGCLLLYFCTVDILVLEVCSCLVVCKMFEQKPKNVFGISPTEEEVVVKMYMGICGGFPVLLVLRYANTCWILPLTE